MQLRDPRLGHPEDLADLPQGQVLVVVEGDHQPLALGQRLDRVGEPVLELRGLRLGLGVDRARVLDRVEDRDLAAALGVGEGPEVVERELVHALDEQQARLAEAISSFADNTMRYLRDEGRLLAEGIEFPALATRFRDRHVLVVARGPGHKHDLRIVRGYIRNFKPVLVGVDGGADACVKRDTPGRHRRRHGFDHGSRAACGAELVIHAYPSTGDAPGAARAELLDLPYHAVPSPGISEDVALLLAYEKGAELIVAVGTHFNLVEFLERSREGMSSTFMARLRVGEILVDAKGVSRLVSRRVGVWPLVAFTGAGLAAIVVAILASPDLRGSSSCSANACCRFRDRLIHTGVAGTADSDLAGLSRCSQPPPRCEHTAEGRAHGRRDRANSATTRARHSVRSEASHDVLASAPTSGASSPTVHLADWWPTVDAVRPDARGFREGARWEVTGPASPTLFRKGGATGLAIVKTIELHERVVWSSARIGSTSR